MKPTQLTGSSLTLLEPVYCFFWPIQFTIGFWFSACLVIRMLILFYKLPWWAPAGRLQSWPTVGYQCRSAWAEATASVSPRHSCHQAWILHLSTGSRMGLKGQERVRNLLPEAPLPPPTSNSTSPSHTQMCSRSAALAGGVAMYVLEYISKPSREPLFAASFSFSLPRLFFPSDTSRLSVRWSKAVDRGVCPLISKHSRGAYGENASEYSPHCAAELTPA